MSISHNFEQDLLSLVEPMPLGAFDRADVDEDVVAAVIRPDESVALFVIEPLDGSVRQTLVLLIAPTRGPRARGGGNGGEPGVRPSGSRGHPQGGLIECDPAPTVCAILLTIEIFLTRNLGGRDLVDERFIPAAMAQPFMHCKRRYGSIISPLDLLATPGDAALTSSRISAMPRLGGGT
jgi:hypothetical protein